MRSENRADTAKEAPQHSTDGESPAHARAFFSDSRDRKLYDKRLRTLRSVSRVFEI